MSQRRRVEAQPVQRPWRHPSTSMWARAKELRGRGVLVEIDCEPTFSSVEILEHAGAIEVGNTAGKRPPAHAAGLP